MNFSSGSRGIKQQTVVPKTALAKSNVKKKQYWSAKWFRLRKFNIINLVYRHYFYPKRQYLTTALTLC